MRISIMTLKNLWIILLLVIVASLIAGCGFKDIDKRIFVIGMGVDKSDDEEEKPYKITLKTVVPSGGTKNAPKPEYTYLTMEAKSIADAVHLLKSHVDKELDFAHAKVILFGDKLLEEEEDMRVLSDFFLRRRDFQQISWVAVGKPSAEDVLKAKPSSEVTGANVLFNIFSGIGTNSSNTVSTYLFDFRRQLIEDGIDAVLPIIETDKKKKKMIVNKAIVFKDKKGKVELDPRQSEIYNVLSNQTTNNNIIIPVSNKKGETFTVYVQNAKTKYQLKSLSDPNKYTLKMTVKMVGVVEESTAILSSSKLDEYSKQASNAAKKEILPFLKEMQKNEVDPIGFGLRYQATHPDYKEKGKEWSDIYPNLEFDVTVKVAIKDVGTTE